MPTNTASKAAMQHQHSNLPSLEDLEKMKDELEILVLVKNPDKNLVDEVTTISVNSKEAVKKFLEDAGIKRNKAAEDGNLLQSSSNVVNDDDSPTSSACRDSFPDIHINNKPIANPTDDKSSMITKKKMVKVTSTKLGDGTLAWRRKANNDDAECGYSVSGTSVSALSMASRTRDKRSRTVYRIYRPLMTSVSNISTLWTRLVQVTKAKSHAKRRNRGPLSIAMLESNTEWAELIRRRHQDELSELQAKADTTSGRKSKRFLNEFAKMKKKKQNPDVAVINANAVNANITKQSVAFVHMARESKEREKRKVKEAEAKARQKEELKKRNKEIQAKQDIKLSVAYKSIARDREERARDREERAISKIKLKRKKRMEEYQKIEAKKQQRENKLVEKYLTKERKVKEKKELKQMILEEERAKAKEMEIRQRIEKHREAQRLEEAAKTYLLHAYKNAAAARNEKLKADEAMARYEGTVSSSEKKNTKNKKGAQSLHIPLTPSPTAKACMTNNDAADDDTLDATCDVIDDEVVRLRKQVKALQKEMNEVEDQLKAKQVHIYENKHHDNRTDDDTTYESVDTKDDKEERDQDDDTTYESVDTKDDKEERDQAPSNQGLLRRFQQVGVADGVAATGYDVLTWFFGDPEKLLSCGSVLESCGTDTSTYEPL